IPLSGFGWRNACGSQSGSASSAANVGWIASHAASGESALAISARTRTAKSRTIGLSRKNSSIGDLSGVEEVVGVQRGLDRAHQAQDDGPVLELEERRLAVADPVLARARALEGDRAAHEPLVEGLRALELVGV